VYFLDGYVHLATIYKRFEDLSYKFMSSNYDEYALDSEDESEPPADAFDVAAMAYQEWLFFQFVTKQSEFFYVCSPTGTSLRLLPDALWTFRHFRGPFLHGYKQHQIIIHHLEDAFLFMDPKNFVIRLDHKSEEIERYDLQENVKILRPLDGWPVCWKSTTKPITDELLLELASLELTDSQARQGRPPKVPVVKEAYEREFPSGHGSMNMKQVWTRLRQSTGIEFSLDTMQRALGKKK
jgi:hypothetical protein